MKEFDFAVYPNITIYAGHWSDRELYLKKISLTSRTLPSNLKIYFPI